MTAVTVGGMDSTKAALKTGQIDGVVIALELGYALEAAKEWRVVSLLAPFAPDFHTHVIFARDELIAKKPEVVERFLRGWFETIAFMRANKARTVEITAKVLNLDKAVIDRVYDEQIKIFTSDGQFDPKALVVLRKSLVEMGLLQQTPEDSRHVHDPVRAGEVLDMKLFECQNCGQPLYFENTSCESCGLRLGYLPERETVTALEAVDGAVARARRAGAALSVLRQCAAQRLQLARDLRSCRDILRGLPSQPHHPGSQQSGEPRALAQDRVRQAPAVLYAAAASPAADHPGRGPQRSRLRFPIGSGRRVRAASAGHDRAHQRSHHPQPGGGR